jgi:hypothetical protein
MNLAEVFFSIITRQAIRRGSYESVRDLIAAISRYIDGGNTRCQPFTWTNRRRHPHPHNPQRTPDAER